jgi:NAD(P)-dependent dehydrogenase (short-subunit alcohol dehydrogenase family)
MEGTMDFTGRTVVVTGAAGNLGSAVAQAFGARGASLVLVDVSREGLEAAHGAESERRLLVPADLVDQAAVDAMVAAALARFGRIDVLCNIAGGFAMGSAVHETDDATWESLFAINVRTLLRTARAVVPVMIDAGGGRIVNVGAFAAQKGVARMGAYVASKSVVIRLTETMSAELREQGINVNCVLPTIIDTPQNRAAMPDADPSRWVSPRDIAAAILFLSSDDARAIHGAALPLTGLV